MEDLSPASLRACRLALGLTVLAALLLRLFRLGSLVLDQDEYFQIYEALKAPSLAAFLDLVRNNPHHALLDPLSTYLAAKLSDSAFVLRLPSALLGTACVPLLYLLGRRLGGRRTGLIAAALLSVSMLHIEWSRRIDFYSALVFWTLMSLLALLRAVERRRSRAFVPYLLVHAVFQYTHPFGAVVGAAEAAWAAAYARRKLLPLCLALAGAAALYAPWAVIGGGGLLGRQVFFYRQALGWHPLGDALRCATGWAQTPEFAGRYTGPGLMALQLIPALAYAGLFALGASRIARRDGGPPGWKLAALLVPAGFVGVAALDYAFSYYFSVRQTLFILPAYLLVAARGLEEILDRARPASWRGAALAAAAAAVVLPFTAVYAADLREQVSEARRFEAAVDETRRETGPGDVLLFPDPNTAETFLYHYDRRAFVEVSPPRLAPRAYLGAYMFRLPDDLWAANGPSRNRVFSILDPWAEGDQERTRWKNITAEMEGRRTLYVHYGLAAEAAQRRLEEFRSATAGGP